MTRPIPMRDASRGMMRASASIGGSRTSDASLRCNPMRLLVTGGAGFIGSEFVRQTLARYPQDQVTVLDKLTYAGNLENLRPVASDARFRFVQGDIADRSAVDNAL